MNSKDYWRRAKLGFEFKWKKTIISMHTFIGAMSAHLFVLKFDRFGNVTFIKLT